MFKSFLKSISVFLYLVYSVNSTEGIYAVATTDTGFKQLLSNHEVAKDIINCIVPDFRDGDKVISLEARPVAIPVLKEGTKKQTFMDFHVITESGKHIIIEMQSRRHVMFDERALFYSCYTFSHQVTDEGFKKDDWYLGIEKVYAIQFLDFDSNKVTNLSKKIDGESVKDEKDTLVKRIEGHKMRDEDYVKHYMFTDVNSGQIIDTLQMIQVELPRANSILNLKNIHKGNAGNVGSNLHWWLAILKNSEKFNKDVVDTAPDIVKVGFSELEYSKWVPNIKVEYQEELSDMKKYSADVNDKIYKAKLKILVKNEFKKFNENNNSNFKFSKHMKDVASSDIRSWLSGKNNNQIDLFITALESIMPKNDYSYSERDYSISFQE